jgi:hypothetical protein
MDAILELIGSQLTSAAAQAWLARNGPFEADVVDGDGSDPDQYLQDKRAGIVIQDGKDNRIKTIFLMSGAKDGFSRYQGSLGHGLSFSSTRQDIERELGKPDFSTPRKEMFGLRFGESIRYDSAACSVHYEFLPDGDGISMVTLMSPDSVPGRENGAESP